MESVKKQILKVILQKAEASPPVNKKSPFIFSLKYICEKLPDLYKPTISREIRQLKTDGLLNYEIVGEKVHGTYRYLFLDTENKKRYTKKAIFNELAETIANMKTNIVSTSITDIDEFLK